MKQRIITPQPYNNDRINEKLKKASRLYESGKLKESKQKYIDVLKKIPQNSDLLQMIGLIENELGNFNNAERYFRKAIDADPNNFGLYITIGQFYIEKNRSKEALLILKEAIKLDNHNPDIFCLYGDAFKQLNLHEKAIECYRKSINLDPEYTLAITKLGSCYRTLNMLDKAFKCYRKVLGISPNDPKALHNLGNLYRKIGFMDDAITHYQRALSQTPDYTEIYESLGNAFQQKKDYASAHDAYLKAQAIDPDNYLINYYIGTNYKEQGNLEESKQWLKKSLEINPDFYPAKMHYLLSLPIIYKNQKEIDLCRQGYAKGIDIIVEEWEAIKSINPESHLTGIKSWTNFNLPYQGKNDLSLQKKIGEYLYAVVKDNFPDKSTKYKKISVGDRKKIKVGYISENMFSHTVGKLFIGWIEQADSSAFNVYCYHTNNRTDQMTDRYKTACFKFCQNFDGIDSIADQIISDGIDVLVYLDIGMNSTTQILAALRLAPVQCVTWGHPVTTGLPTIDYFLSSELMEPANGMDHYSEKLIKLPNLSIYFNKPELPRTTIQRKSFGLCDEDFVYFASQSLFKYLPEDDFIYAAIALSVPMSKFVFLEHESKHVTDLFKQRLKLEFQKLELDYEVFCIFQPRLSYADFIALNSVSNVLLDPPSWSGGMTSLEGISCGLPIVTLPGELMRSRHTYAILKFIELYDTIARDRKDYIRIATQLGTDTSHYMRCRKAISENIGRLFKDKHAIRGLESFYKDLIPIH